MSSLPQLSIKPDQQIPDPLDQYSKVVGIQRLALQGQLQKQQIQNAQLEGEEKKIQVAQAQRDQNDQKISSDAWQNSGGDPQKFLQSLQQNGASFKTYQTVSQGMTATRKALADADESTFKAHGEANKLIGDGIQSILNAPPEDQAAQYTLVTNGLKRDPNLAKYLPANLPPQFPGQDALKSAAIGVGMNEKLFAQAEADRKAAQGPAELAKANADADAAQSTAIVKKAEAAAVQGGGAIPGVPLDVQAVNAWLRRPENKGKDIAAAKMATTPAGITLGNQLGAPGAGSAMDQAAERYSTDGTLPAGFSRSPGTTAAIIKRAAELHPDQNIAANKATFGADAAALKKVQGTFDQVSAFENTAIKNLDLYVEKAKAIPDLGTRFANVPLRAITKSMVGDANYAAMETARQTAATEAAKVLGSANASGVLSDSQKHEALDVLDGKLPLAATIKVVDTFKQDFANRHAGYQQDIDAIKARLNGKPTAQAPTAATPQSATNKANGHKIVVKDGKWVDAETGAPI